MYDDDGNEIVNSKDLLLPLILSLTEMKSANSSTFRWFGLFMSYYFVLFVR